MQEPAARTDLRLLVFGAGIWCGALLAAGFDWWVNLGLLICLAFVWRQAPKFKYLFLAVLVGAAVYSLHAQTLHSSVLAKLAQQRSEVVLTATATSDIKRTASKVTGSIFRKPQSSFLARASIVEQDNQIYKMRLPIRVIMQDEYQLIPGDKFRISGDLIVTREKRVAATLISNQAIEIQANAGEFANFLSRLRSDFRELVSTYNSTAATLIPGMILGDTSLQSEEFSKQMRRAGLSHLTAVSGANFAIVSALVLALTRFLSRRILFQLATTTIFLIIFLLLVRPSPSVLRAGVMAGVVLLARATGNTRNAAAALSAAICTILLLDPFQAQDPGFVLSVLATSGLIFIAPQLTTKLEKYLPKLLAEVVAVSTAATVLCTPYIIFLSGELSILSVAFNVLVSPFIAPITITGFLAVIFLPLDWVAQFLVAIAELLARWIVLISGLALDTPTLAFNPWFLILIFGLALILRGKFRKFTVLFITAFVIVNLIPQIGFPGKDWKVVQCDVGQGDALVVNLSQGAAALFDVGPDPLLIDRCLKTLNIEKLPLIVLSHNHADHTFGLSGAVAGREVGEIWSNGNVVLQSHLQKKVRVVSKGDSATLGQYHLEVLWPASSSSYFATFSKLPGDGSEENNQSLVVLLRNKNQSILVTGDIEPEAQAQIIRGTSLGEIDILKVAHHGSRFQDEGFLIETKPKLALISVGKGNSYGHPDTALIQKMSAWGVPVKRTDLDGPIAASWRFDEEANRYIFTTSSMRKEWWRIQWR